jgi:hypothetical protein
MANETEKRAPVQGYTPGIPWPLHLEAYDAYCKKWGAQPALIDLEGRNCRGGFSTGELDEFIPGWRDKISEIGQLKAEIESLRTKLAAAESELAAIHAQPIEQAPKDGTKVLVFFSTLFGGMWDIAFWNTQQYHSKPRPYWSGVQERIFGVISYRKGTPTHFLPYPANPLITKPAKEQT